MTRRYDPQSTEEKWQRIWEEREESFDDIVLVVSQGDLVAFVFSCPLEEFPAAQAGTQETGTRLAVVITVGQLPDITFFNNEVVTFLLAILLQDTSLIPIRILETQIHMHGQNKFGFGDKKKRPGNELEEGQAVRPAGYSDDDPGPFTQHFMF